MEESLSTIRGETYKVSAWYDVETQEDADAFLEEVWQLHDWFINGYDFKPRYHRRKRIPMTPSFEDSLTVAFIYDSYIPPEEGFYELEIEFKTPMWFTFGCLDNMFPLYCAEIKKIERGWVMVDEGITDEDLKAPTRILSNFAVVCESLRWRKLFYCENDEDN